MFSKYFKAILGALFPSNKKEPMPPKDPMDWSLTPNSTQWEIDSYCPQCKSRTGYSERMCGICNSCGYSFVYLALSYRSYRKIWNGKKWVWQYKYGNGCSNYDIVE